MRAWQQAGIAATRGWGFRSAARCVTLKIHEQQERVGTGSCGLIGSELCVHFYQAGYSVVGINNNQRGVFLALREIHLGRRNAGAARFLRTRSQYDSRHAKEFFAGASARAAAS
jgi:hypothetical protein